MRRCKALLRGGPYCWRTRSGRRARRCGVCGVMRDRSVCSVVASPVLLRCRKSVPPVHREGLPLACGLPGLWLAVVGFCSCRLPVVHVAAVAACGSCGFCGFCGCRLPVVGFCGLWSMLGTKPWALEKGRGKAGVQGRLGGKAGRPSMQAGGVAGSSRGGALEFLARNQGA